MTGTVLLLEPTARARAVRTSSQDSRSVLLFGSIRCLDIDVTARNQTSTVIEPNLDIHSMETTFTGTHTRL